ITAAGCLFLAGKVEETPKKCKDIVKITQSILSPQLFSVFSEDPKEEIMTLERILLQTIKFDLQVDHPYACLLKFAKQVKILVYRKSYTNLLQDALEPRTTSMLYRRKCCGPHHKENKHKIV
ncbi:Hypothetical predicted protein, partial [Mytilus galloprovincialis]